MTETGLLIAQGAVLVLLLAFLVAIVRASGKYLSRAVPPPLPMDDPVDRDTDAHPVIVPSHHDDPFAHPAAPAHAAPAAPEWPADEPLFTDPPVPAPAAYADPFPPLAEPAADAPEPPAVGTADIFGDDEPFPVSNGAPSKPDGDSTFLDLSTANLQPRLVVEQGPGLMVGTVFPLGQGLTIGRSRSNELHVDDTFVSHMHARILRRGAFFYVEDLGSTNGTFVNDNRVEGDAPLRVRDTLRMGETVLRYEE
ncbi:MAG: FHA domain-containing protein [Thermoleophilia bacterium]